MAKRRKSRGDASDQLDLFPFLSIMLCVVGVLAFVQVLLGMSSKTKVRLAGDVQEGYRVAYQIVCGPTGNVLAPPADRLGALIARASEKDAADLRAIQEERKRLHGQLTRGASGERAEQPISEQQIRTLLYEVRRINTLARTLTIPYEEFLLFAIRPGGGAAYHRFQRQLSHVDFQSTPESGLLALDADWQFAAPAGEPAPHAEASR